MPSMPTLRQLDYFVCAARLGTFAAAANARHIAQPSLSEQIATLERTLDVVLFTRTSRKLLLTDSGKQLLPLAERVLAEAERFVESGRGVQALEEGTVSFGTFNSAHLYLLTDLIREFHELHPSVRIRVVGLNSAEVADAVRSGELEAGIVQLPVDDRELDLTPPVFTDSVVYVSVDPGRTSRPVGIHELADRPLILSEARWSKDDPLRVSLLAHAQQAGVTLDPMIEVEFQTHALELAAQGVGDSLVSYFVGRSLIQSRGLHWALLEPPIVEHYAFVTRRNASISPATREFMRLALKVIQQVSARQDGPMARADRRDRRGGRRADS
ncbi:DNA-binding transcriptional LysR family regulator [Rathayibacter sp. PhB179]|uniref:LysR family transcriptional regulator n=2 Tax=Rathayibacter TaxID=33886 RepID=UPI0010511880|nr:LysR family transcriptional regulator [Rathayibacter caricis]MCJ1697727.1 LysR family transcriptional regulator [Rathayibacter caricis]TCL79426.1 DNA-binding transcriptional LysR family regulator [Rathayibacter sp. PhB192]TCM25305.1 DNA-binding transcriptional LysR family regulator [Rathayibacter sp. PhB179]